MFLTLIYNSDSVEFSFGAKEIKTKEEVALSHIHIRLVISELKSQ